MKKKLVTLSSIIGMMVMMTTEISASSVLSKISTMVIVFTSLAGAAIWIYAIKKRKEMDD